MTERQFIRDLQSQFPTLPPVKIGIGDDGAVLDVTADSQQVVVTDLLLDGVHFDLNATSPFLAGRKAVAVNLSDLAAMGCRPTAAFVSLAVPRTHPQASSDFLRELYRGIQQMTDKFQFSLAGGDTNSWDGPFAINVCLTGVPFSGRPFLRSDARPGDAIFVTGPLGGSLHGGRHLTFMPRLQISEWLSRTVEVGAMLDLSDGLSIDLHRMMEASAAAAEISTSTITFILMCLRNGRLTNDWQPHWAMAKISNCCSPYVNPKAQSCKLLPLLQLSPYFRSVA